MLSMMQIIRVGEVTYRVLMVAENKILIIDCEGHKLPEWKAVDTLEGYEDITADWHMARHESKESIEEMGEDQKRQARERYHMIAQIIPVVGDVDKRNVMITAMSEEYKVCKRTIKAYLIKYLVEQDLSVLVPKKREVKALTKHEKNIRWGLNKYYYTGHKNAIRVAYRMMLQAKYVDAIYLKLYTALLLSLEKKCMKNAMLQRYENARTGRGGRYAGIIGGSDSFTIIGSSGIGKSSAIIKAIDVITEDKTLTLQEPYTMIIPYLVVQCPFDAFVKGLLMEILRRMDEYLESGFYESIIKSRNCTADLLIGTVSTLAVNHIGVLVIDEIQNLATSKNGRILIGSLTQLINSSGISIAMVGTPESVPFFTQGVQLARRSVGLNFSVMSYNEDFEQFCKILFSYQYTSQTTTITEGIMIWLYEHSSGIISVVVSLIHDAQEIAIMKGLECLNIETLEMAYQSRMQMLHLYTGEDMTIQQKKKNYKKSIREKKAVEQFKENEKLVDSSLSIQEVVADLRKKHFSIEEAIPVLGKYISLEEITC